MKTIVLSEAAMIEKAQAVFKEVMSEPEYRNEHCKKVLIRFSRKLHEKLFGKVQSSERAVVKATPEENKKAFFRKYKALGYTLRVCPSCKFNATYEYQPGWFVRINCPHGCGVVVLDNKELFKRGQKPLADEEMIRTACEKWNKCEYNW